MANPFDDPERAYLALRNDAGQYSLWPLGLDVPPGWAIVFGQSSRRECLEFVEANWTDLSPLSEPAR
ncbi:MbtH family protein [Nonomuraea sp. NBC_01738]|uniref:MbtH family protein n=1 Tax=Nonomuraea sp. NBC_01738 TaxID=2976003 RepID=UPI002E0E54BA